MWRASGHPGGYTANEDERFYFTVFKAAAQQPLGTINPFDDEWRNAAPSGVRLPALLYSLPVRAAVDAGVAWDMARWLGNFASVLLLIAIGGLVATPAVGAAAAILILSDPGAYYGKPIFSLIGMGVHHAGDPHQLVAARSMVSALTLPFFLLAVLGTLKLARRGVGRGTWGVGRRTAMIAAVGLSGHLFTWAGALAGAAAAAVLHPRRRRMLVPVAIGCVVALVFVFLGGLGKHGAPLDDIIMRLGAIRTRRPQFLTHSGFWAAALAASALVFMPGRFRSGARALGAMFLGAWALAMLHTPILGLDVESYHFAHALSPLAVLAWCALLWHLWRRRRRRQPMIAFLLWPVTVALCLVAVRGPVLAARGLGAFIEESGTLRGEARQWLEAGNIPAGASVVGPRALQLSLAAEHDGRNFGNPYQMLWSVPDTVLFERSVCAAMLTGADSSEVVREALKPRPGSIAVWHEGRPADVSIEGVRVYFDIFEQLAHRLGRHVSTGGSCVAVPDYALAVGKAHVKRALRLGEAHWMAPDSSAAWITPRR